MIVVGDDVVTFEQGYIFKIEAAGSVLILKFDDVLSCAGDRFGNDPGFTLPFSAKILRRPFSYAFETTGRTVAVDFSAIASGAIFFHRPRVKSGMATGMLPVATESEDTSMILLHAAAS